MHIGAISKKTYKVANYQKKNINNSSKLQTFKGKPAELYYDSFAPYYFSEYTSGQAISIYEKLKQAKYTDITHETWQTNWEPDYSYIRRSNLSFLDKVKQTKEKVKFINYYENLTGFPNLEKVSSRIVDELYNTCSNVEKSRSIFEEDKYKIYMIGYNDTCSIGHKKALPGSDIDGAYVIIEGSGNLEEDKTIVDNFKSYLWEKTDSRILSYNHQSAFPQVYTKTQFYTLLDVLEEKSNELNLNEEQPSDNFFKKKQTKFENYLSQKNSYSKNYVKVNDFYIELCKKLNQSFSYSPKFDNPTKELAKNFGFLVETIMQGEIIGNDKEKQQGEMVRKHLSTTNIGKLTNLSQLQALKTNPPAKPKLELRKKLIEQYENATTDGKYEIIKELIKASCGENDNNNLEQYFAPGENNFAPLLKALGKE